MPQYEVKPLPISGLEAFRVWTHNELAEVSKAFAGVQEPILPTLFKPPAKLVSGMIILADGTRWNPGNGPGFYGYYGNAWHFISAGPTGPAGPAGPAGPTGAAGVGVPVGGTTAQVLGKNSATNYDTSWIGPMLPLTGGTMSGDIYMTGAGPLLSMTANGVRQWRLMAYSDGNWYLTDMSASVHGFYIIGGSGNVIFPQSVNVGGNITGATVAASTALQCNTTSAAAAILQLAVAGVRNWQLFTNTNGVLYLWDVNAAAARMTFDLNGNALFYISVGISVGAGAYAMYSAANNLRSWQWGCSGADGSWYLFDTSAGTTRIKVSTSGLVQVGQGITCRSGTSGAPGNNSFNIAYAPPAQMWVDTTNLGAFAYTSDYRTKRDVEPLPSTWECVKALRPVRYRYKDWTPHWEEERNEAREGRPFFTGSDEERWGFIAHELQEDLIPAAATGSKDEDNVIQSPDLLVVLATVTKALQEAMGRIEILEGTSR